MSLAICALPGNEVFAAMLADRLGCARVRLEVRRFPDGESHLRFLDPPDRQRLALVCALNDPDAKTQALLFAAATARELGAAQVGLVAPYLAYMRQDRRFASGEAVTSALFAAQLERAFDWVVSVDAHLHRRRSLAEIFGIPALDVSVAAQVAAWIRGKVRDPLIVGPDRESARWAAAVAQPLDAPHVVLSKLRSGDRSVRVEAPSLAAWRGRKAVLVDDIISTARTMAAGANALRAQGFDPPMCIGVHGLFAGDALDALRAAGVARIATSNTVPHPTNRIDATPAVARALRDLLNIPEEKP
jgi:ribose-phosphate pyrophosphokinase